jgi:hypothetical protein
MKQLLMNADTLHEYIKKNGLTLAKTTENFEMIPAETKLWFGSDGKSISTWDNDSNNKNQLFHYEFTYNYCSIWHNDYKGMFIVEVEEPTKYYIGQKLRMKKRYSGEGKGKIVYVAKIVNGEIYIIETDGTWGWERDERIPTDYKSKSGNLYWAVGNYEDGYEIIEEKETQNIHTWKAGDKIRIKEDCSGCYKGRIYTLKLGDTDGDYPFELYDPFELYAWDETTKNCGCNCMDNWELIEPKINNPKHEKIIISCPTQTDWDRITKKNKLRFATWYKYKENSVIFIDKHDNRYSYDNLKYAIETYPNTPIISADKYLGITTTYQHLINKPKQNKFMSNIKCAFNVIKKMCLSTEDKILMEYNCIDEQGNWLEQGHKAIYQLEINERGVKSIEEMTNKYKYGKGLNVSTFEFHDLVIKWKQKLIENLTADKKENK